MPVFQGGYTIFFFIQFMEFSWQTYCSGLPFPPPEAHILSELSTMTPLSWVALHAWLIASLSYASPFATTRQWSVKGIHESPLNSKEIKTVNPKGNLPWIFIRRTDAEAEAPILWPPDKKSWLIGKDPDAGKDVGIIWVKAIEGSRRRGQQRMRWLDGITPSSGLSGREFEQAPGDSEGQGSLVGCSPWGHEELDTTWWLITTTTTNTIFHSQHATFIKKKQLSIKFLGKWLLKRVLQRGKVNLWVCLWSFCLTTLCSLCKARHHNR